MNKIIHQFQLKLIYGLVFLLSPLLSGAQDSLLNQYGLLVIKTRGQLLQHCKDSPGKAMADLRKNIPALVTSLRYASTDNFMHMKLYPPVKTTYLRKAAADSLLAVQQELKLLGLGLKIFDAYRPYSVTEKMWEPIKDERYVADPKKGSGHNRGIAVDLTIIKLAGAEELEMGTGFDNFSDTAHHAFRQLPPAVLQNRQLLKSVMEKHGFKALETEWWHYYLPNAKDFELLDISFAELEKMNRTKTSK